MTSPSLEEIDALVARLISSSCVGAARDELLRELGKLEALGAPKKCVEAIGIWSDLMRQAATALTELQARVVEFEQADVAAKHDIERLMATCTTETNRADSAESRVRELEAEREALAKDARRYLLLATPEIHDFMVAVEREAAHQRERWSAEHDAGKSAEDWLWLVAYLSVKASQADRYSDREKYLHHIITCAAACCNWHAWASGTHTAMRPGSDPQKFDAMLPPAPDAGRKGGT